MGMKIDRKKVSEAAWGDVDKGALGRRLAAGYAAGEASKALIREAYAFVPEEAFGKDADGKPTFAASKAWGPHHTLSGDALVVNRGGVQAAAGALAGARSKPSLSGAKLKNAKRHIRKHYRALKLEMPDSLTEGLRRAPRGKPLTELVKGSLDYAMERIRTAFQKQFPAEDDGGGLWINEFFSDHVIVNELGELPPDEYWAVPIVKMDETGIVFAEREAWELVELDYQPASPAPGMAALPTAMESIDAPRQRQRLEEAAARLAEFEEASGTAAGTAAGTADGNGGTRRIRINGLMQAGVVNGNGRRYSAAVIEAAVSAWRAHLHESAGQGRLKVLTGEAEHPVDKGNRRAQFLETVVRWTEVGFDGADVYVAGELIPTTKGRDVAMLMEAGVRPGGSVRGFYESKAVREGDQVVEEVTWCEITGADLVGNPSFANVADLLEAKRVASGPVSGTEGDEEMTVEEMMGLIKQHPELFKGVVAESVKEMTDAQRQALEEQVRAALGVDKDADLARELAEAAQAKRQLEADARAKQVEQALIEATKALPYGKALNEAFVAAVTVAKPESAEAVKALVEAKRVEYDRIASLARLGQMGMRVDVLGPVIEREAGVPEFARASHEFTESMVKRGIATRRNLAEPKTVNEQMAARVLERFDKVYRLPLMREAELAETELSTDLNLPYSVSRAILAEVWPGLVATSIFDVDVTEQTPTRVYYEDYQDVSGKHVAITDEAVTADLDAWVSLAHKMVEPGTVVVTNAAGTVTYVEGTDYVIDYLDGAIYCPSGLTITDAQSLLADYHYDSVREGENTAIQRAKMVLGYATLDCKANRLATQITNEAVVFSRSQMGWDATSRTLAGLVSELRREIDRALMFNALSKALMVASNSGGTWTAATDPLIDLVGYAGVAKVKLAKRYFEPNWLLFSLTNSDTLANWDGFTQAGSRPDADLSANGYVGRLKGLPVFASTEFSDGYGLIGNRQVVHYRVYQPMQLKGPFPSYSSDKLVAADQWYAEQYDGWLSPVAGKASYVKIA